MAIIGRLDIITNEGYIEEALEQCEYEGLNKEQTALEIKKIIDEVVKLVSKNESLHLVRCRCNCKELKPRKNLSEPYKCAECGKQVYDN